MGLPDILAAMTPEKVFHQILALCENWRVDSVDYAEKELKMCQLESEIVCALPRGQFRDSQKVYMLRDPRKRRSTGCTQEFEAFALTLAREMSVKKAAEILGETDQRLWRILFANVQAAWEQLSCEKMVWLGADEMNRRKGHNYLTVFADLQAKRVLLAMESKTASVWAWFADELHKHNGHPRAITQVTIDMIPACQKGVAENIGNPAVVIYKFHLVTQVAEAVDKEGRLEAKRYPQTREQLAKSQWRWRKNPKNLTSQEYLRGEEFTDKPRLIGLAYSIRVELQSPYLSANLTKARQRFTDWSAWVHEMAAETQNIFQPMVEVGGTVERRFKEIPAHWKAGLFTGLIEGINSFFSANKRKARGYRSSNYQITMLYFVADKLPIP